jgi:magnesium-transporting ATPase (P-type)
MTKGDPPLKEDVAARTWHAVPPDEALDLLGSDLILLGLFGLIDPPREEAIQAVVACRSAGIRVQMVTGDHARTASAVARELGLETRTGRSPAARWSTSATRSCASG